MPRFDYFVRDDQEQGSVNGADLKKGGRQDARRNPAPPQSYKKRVTVNLL